ncbi:uncharacterized protein LOC128260320 [Drosophila gunungcola]|uniref:Protein TsetseEP domain-containing protein n=1 Tax=Drosophila gunungcola TaxID=103775 RepID=A0A9Q0BL33_9MUSC|nr:uncharacterized protein LOC128260320 [Drosophila gunungcola]KAI8036157.1 hypothetical protein M5D96_011017 [Drosophila gunungcola]
MRSTILVLAFALAAVSAVPLQEGQDASLQELTKEFGLDFDLNFDLDLGFNVDQELTEDGTVEIDEFAFVDRMVHFLIAESKALAWDIVRLTERQLLKIFLYPMRQLEQLAQDIERKALDAADCAVNVTTNVAEVVASSTLDFLGCGRDAALTSINLCLDTKKSVLQLTLDGYQIIKLQRKCKSHPEGGFLRKTCKTRLYAKCMLYIGNGQASMRHLIGLRKSVPAVATDATSCTTTATANAVRGFDEISATIDTCVDTMIK